MRNRFPRIRSYRFCRVLLALGVIGLGLLALAKVGSAQMKMKSKGIDLCIMCHPDIKKRFDTPVQHTAVKKGECTGCHNPHASKEKHLLAHAGSALCFECHAKEKRRFQQENIHTPVRNGECTKCHDPHGSENRYSLVKKGSALCLSCHPKIEAVQKAKFVHSPVRKGECRECHDPHASKNPGQLVDSQDRLCRKCHDVSRPGIQKAHFQFPMGKVNCTSCHNPHGSDQAGLIRSNAHKVFRGCGNCHKREGSSPQELIVRGSDLCFKCHSKKKDDLKRKVVHKATEEGCTACHTPHASDDRGLLKGAERPLCFGCHGDVRDHMTGSVSIHPVKAEGGRCTICHEPHASDRPRLFPADTIDMCKKCHTKHAQFGHPYGPGVIDPRTNQIVTCLSCHGPHGTQEPFTLLKSARRALCIQCHRTDEPAPKKTREPIPDALKPGPHRPGGPR
jgi:predicted CXXCH cytochrome family protein